MTILRLCVDSRIFYDGEVYSVVGLEGTSARLRGRSGLLTLISTRELLANGEVLDDMNRESAASTASLAADELERLTKAETDQFKVRRAHVLEAETGYRSGNPEDPVTREPRSGCDLALTSITDRMQTKALETGWSVSTLNRCRREYKDRGPHALLDGRKSKARSAGRSLDPRARDAFLKVIDGLTYKSNSSMKQVIEEVRKRLDQEYGKGRVPLPSLSTLYRVLGELTDNKKTFGNAKRRREIAGRPQTPYQRFAATRPGETVLIDATRLDFFALDPATLRWTSVDLIVALDMFTRSLLAWRFVPRGSKAVDASLLLRDIIVPKQVRSGWPESTRWPYHGVPESLVLGAF